MHSFTKYVNPHLGRLLESLKIDKSFIKGEGCYLYDSDGIEYLDCIASYGALPFGHNPYEIWQCILDFRTSREPNFIQPSALNAAGELAGRLIEIAPPGLKYVTFTNSGAETVEAAIKLCRSAAKRKGILAARNSFHGKTLGALSATGNPSYQSAFGAPVNGFSFVNFGDIDALESELKNNYSQYAAFLVEPIQGEGGIIEPPMGYLKSARELCSKYGVLLVVDEIQTGLGRTGEMFACEKEGVSPDILLIAKALGGGMIPIGACICTGDVYNEDFALKHSSTFSGNSLACRIGLKVLDMLSENNSGIITKIRANGEILKSGLIALKEKYPDLVKSIRGRGLMLGIEFGLDRNSFPDSLLGVMAEQDLLTPVISSYLLNVEKVRVAPTLNGNNVIRIEPPLIINAEQCTRALEGIDNMLGVLDLRNSAAFLSHLIGVNSSGNLKPAVHKIQERVLPSFDEAEGRFAFLVHPVDLENYAEFDESLCSFNSEELKKLADMWNGMVDPFVLGKVKIESAHGKKAYGEFILIPKTAEQFINMPREEAVKEIKKGIELAKTSGAKIVGLGAYTSVVSGGGLYLKDEGIAITTGNSYTVVSAVEAVTAAMEKIEIPPENAAAAVIGAAGSIGRGVSILLSEKVSMLLLIGSSKNESSSLERLYKVAAEIIKYAAYMIRDKKIFKPGTIIHKLSKFDTLPDCESSIEEFILFARSISHKNSPIIVSTSIEASIPSADIIISATNTPHTLITPDILKYGAIVCDMSRPSNIRGDVNKARPDVLVIDGGVIEVPGSPYLGWNFGFDKGQAYACMSETMMLALEHHYFNTSLGSSGITLESILFTRELAVKHGFRLADFKSFNKPVSSERWEQLSKLHAAQNQGNAG